MRTGVIACALLGALSTVSVAGAYEDVAFVSRDASGAVTLCGWTRAGIGRVRFMTGVTTVTELDVSAQAFDDVWGRLCTRREVTRTR